MMARVKPTQQPVQRRKRARDTKHLLRIKSLPCLSCGAPPPSQACHIRYSDAEHGNVNPGMGRKPDDMFTLPLCPDCHLDGPLAQHKCNEREFWERLGIDPIELSKNLYLHSWDEALCLEIWLRARRIIE